MLKKALFTLGNSMSARLGTIAATWLVTTLGVDGELARQIGLGLSAGFLVGLDVLADHFKVAM